ncbi:MAG: PH domain-containing protein [Ruminococcaceae bacterium]|nr:PH domain-containing protein [Oscillospiraceae bacterium]
MSPCTNNEVQWRDRKCYCGIPLSFESYAVSHDRLFLTCGFLNQSSKEIQLHRVRDIALSRSLSQRLLGVGTVSVTTSDKKVVVLENIRNPAEVKELLYQNAEEQKRIRRFRYGEFLPYADIDFDN